MATGREIIVARAARAALWAGVGGALVTSLAVVVAGRRSIGLPLLLGGIAALGRAALCRPVATRSTASRTRIAALASLRFIHLGLGLLHAAAAIIPAALSLPAPITLPCTIQPDKTCLNEPSLYLLLLAVYLGLNTSLNLILHRPRVHPPLIPQTNFVRIKLSLVQTVPKALTSTPRPAALFAILYWWKGTFVRDFIVSLFNMPLNQPPLDGILAVLNPALLIPVILHTILFYIIEYFTMMIFEIFITEHMTFPIEQSATDTALYQELTGDDEILKQMASIDLSDLASRDPIRRNQIFSLSRPGGHPTNWNNVSLACLKIINAHISDIDGIIGEPKTVKPIKLETPVRRSLRNLSAPYTVTPKIPEVSFKESIRSAVEEFLKYVRNKPVVGYFLGELTEVKVKDVAYKSQIVSKVVQGLSGLVSASLVEDTYGVVQNDLPTVISALVHLKLSLDKLTKSGIVNKKSLKKDAVVVQTLTEVKSAVKRSIYRITITFNHYIKDVNLDNDVYSALVPFINMCES